MATKGKKSSPKKPYERVFPKKVTEETAHYNAILIEDLKDQFRFVTEKVGSMEESFNTKLDETTGELKREVSDTRNALALRMGVVEVELGREMTRARNDISSLKQDVAKLDTKLTHLDTKIDRIGDAVQRHEEEITAIKKAG